MQPFLVPISFVVAWALVILSIWSLFAAARDGVKTAHKMHQIPCSNCQFFTDNYLLKCTVNPSVANTEDAIGCGDYQPRTNSMFY